MCERDSRKTEMIAISYRIDIISLNVRIARIWQGYNWGV